MSDQHDLRDLEQRLVRSLESAAPRPDPRLAERLLSRTAATRQRRGWASFSTLGRALAAATVVAVALAVGLAVGDLRRDVGGPSDSPLATADVATPSTSPSPTTDTESPTAEPSAEPSPRGQRCANDTLGYSVSYPSDWYANDAVEPDDPAFDPVPACQYFGEGPMEIAPNAGLPPTVAIGFSVGSGEPQPWPVIESHELTVDGRPAMVREIAAQGDGPFLRDGDFVYEYLVELPGGDVLVGSTDSTRDGDYDVHKAVLDRMMESLELTDGGR